MILLHIQIIAQDSFHILARAQKNLTVLKELLLFRQKYGKRTSFSRNGSNLDITALAGYDLSGKI